ncbi:hypothetical protein [Bacillus solitudinis]|uniref:hypothetical protein n=1 Tax=Bacillus solitudinis TaxID=2014074 RepID=UPI000C24F48F|nr:hypothetical protein [Bacillus solitudinis]
MNKFIEQLTFEEKQKMLWQALTGLSQDEMEERVLNGVLELVVKNNINNLLVISETTFPKRYLMPIDKISNALFDGKLSRGKNYRVENSGKNKNLFAKVDFDFTKLPGVTISRNLDWHDRVVHNAIISLYVDGKNEYITPLMIHRAKEGDSRARMTPKQKEDIENSIEILSSARISIDTTADYGVDKTIYTGNLIYTKRVDVQHKGEKKEWIYVMEEPILYQYAHKKNQIANTLIQTIKTPVNKTKEIRVLQEYLLYRIKSKGMSRIIRYDTIYEKLGVKEGSESSLRKKRNKIRKAAKAILDDFIDKKVIKGYKENTGSHNEKISIQVIQ